MPFSDKQSVGRFGYYVHLAVASSLLLSALRLPLLAKGFHGAKRPKILRYCNTPSSAHGIHRVMHSWTRHHPF